MIDIVERLKKRIISLLEYNEQLLQENGTLKGKYNQLVAVTIGCAQIGMFEHWQIVEIARKRRNAENKIRLMEGNNENEKVV